MLHEVITSEKVPFTYRVAGIGSRVLAGLADLGILLLLLLAGVMVGITLEGLRAGLGGAVLILWLFALMCCYFLLFEWLWLGQTPGKRLMGIRVIQWQGTSLSFSHAAVRNLVRVVDLLPGCCGVGLLVAACNREQRRLGDLAAGTLVVYRERPQRPPRTLRITAAGSAQAYEAALRQRLEQLDRKQKQTLLDLCLRRDQLRIRARSRQFSAVAAYFRTQMGLTPREYESDEKFVMYLASVLSSGAKASETVVAGLRGGVRGAGPNLRDSA